MYKREQETRKQKITEEEPTMARGTSIGIDGSANTANIIRAFQIFDEKDPAVFNARIKNICVVVGLTLNSRLSTWLERKTS